MFEPLSTAGAMLGAAFALAVPAPAIGASYDEAAYFAFADRMQPLLDSVWDEQAGRYTPSGGGTSTLVNASALLTHSVAAMRGVNGPARQDGRARRLARRLTDTPPFVQRLGDAPRESQAHAPGWGDSMTGPGKQHLVIDAEVVDALTFAWRARHALKLGRGTVRRIADRVHRTAHGSFWRYPAIRLNQINWYSLVYASAATVSDDRHLLRRDFAGQLRRFVEGIRHPRPGTAGNLGPGMRFHYLPDRPVRWGGNLDSAEYANIVASFTRFYPAARRGGMAPLPGADVRLLRKWLGRVVAGYWTHGGYLNWDTGLGFRRWHQAKKLGLAQQALIGIATARELRPSPAHGRWAKHLLDRGFDLYDRLVRRAGGLPAPVLFGVSVVPQSAGSATLAVARVQANAARAVDAGLGRLAAEEPPPLYAYDPDIGRLAVTTPTYNTAVVAVNQGAVPYGGTELARLYDSDQDVAANVGGRSPAAFGVMIRDVSGRRLLASQTGRRSVARGRPPLRLLAAPRGTGARVSTRASAGAFAGRFRELRVEGETSTRGLGVRTSHRFRSDSIETRWTARGAGGRARHTVDVLFPSWGPAARLVAVLRDGRRLEVREKRIPLPDVAYFHVISEHSGYAVIPASRPPGATAHSLATRPQASAPSPGRTLAIQLVRSSHFATVSFTARIVPLKGALPSLAQRWPCSGAPSRC